MHADDAPDDVRPDCSTDSAGLHWSPDAAIDAAATVDANRHAPADLYHEIATSDGFQRDLVDAARELLAGTRRPEWTSTLLEAGVTARDGRYAQLAGWLDRPPEADAHQDALEYTAALGQGTVTVFGERCTLQEALDGDLVDGPLALLEATDRTPTVAVRLGEAFRERPREQRKNTLALLATLGTVCDITLVCGRITARWLRQNHRSHHPAEFDERLNAGREEGLPTEDVVDEALVTLDPDGTAVGLLRSLADEPAETAAQKSLASLLSLNESTVSTHLNKLEALALAERFSAGVGNHVELLPAGSAFLDRLDAELGRQAELDREFDGTGQQHNRPCNPAHTRGAPDGEAAAATADRDGTAPYRTRFLGRADHAAAAGTATSGAVTAVRAPVPDVEDAEDRHTRWVSYDADRDEAVVAVRAAGPLQYITSVALSLASPRFFDQALPVNRLESLDLSPRILRGARCVGGLSSEAEDDGEVLRDRLVEWGQDLAGLTTDLRRDEYDDRDRLRGEIIRSAHGLAGTIVHLLDVAGVDLTRELRVPSGLGHDRLAELARTISVATAIQSRYGHYAAYRLFFEQRDEKRQQTLSPDVDAADPFGSYIGGLVVRGPDGERLGQHLEARLAEPAPVHEDAPEVAVRVPVTTPGREDYAEVVSRMTAQKNLRSTRRAVTLFRALSTSPYAVAEAIHWLQREDRPRDIRLDEVRVTLAHLEPDRLLANAPPSVSKAVAALLRSAQPLSKSTLAEKAGISTRSLRRHLDVLVAIDLVRETDEGVRLALPTSDERGREIVPDAVDDGLAARQDLLFDVVVAVVDDPARFGNPDDVVNQAFVGFPPDFDALRRAFPDLNPWVFDFSRDFCDEPVRASPLVTFGPTVEQASLQAATSGGAST